MLQNRVLISLGQRGGVAIGLLVGAFTIFAISPYVAHYYRRAECTKIVWLYQSALGRPPTPREVSSWFGTRVAWVKIAERLTSQESILTSEFHLEKDGFVRWLYGNIGSFPNEEGVNYWMSRLEKLNGDRVQLISEFAGVAMQVSTERGYVHCGILE